jgi:glycosyltransferase involved in cell wall biosynthesis
MIDSTVGELFETGNPTDLANAVCRSLEDPEGRTAQALRGRERVLNTYTYEHNAEDYEKIYLSMISPKD